MPKGNTAKKKPEVADPKFVRWAIQGKALKVSTHQWAIADWILRGIKKFPKGKVYTEAVKLTGMTRQTLQQFKLTAERFRKLTRVKELSFGHHRVVASKDFGCPNPDCHGNADNLAALEDDKRVQCTSCGRIYKPDEERRRLLLKYGMGVSIHKLISGLKKYEEDKEDDKNISDADLAADAIVRKVKAFQDFLGKDDFDTVLDERPKTRYADLLNALKTAATKLAEKIKELEGEEDGGSAEETKAMGARA